MKRDPTFNRLKKNIFNIRKVRQLVVNAHTSNARGMRGAIYLPRDTILKMARTYYSKLGGRK